MKKGLLIAALVLGASSAAALWRAAATAGEAVRPVAAESDLLRRAHPVAGEQARGRRVLVLVADPGKARSAVILESGRSPGGWALYPAVPPGAPDFGRALESLAAAAGRSWDRAEEGFPADVERALALFAVKVVLVDDAGKGATPLRVLDRAEPVLRIDGGAGSTGRDAVGLANALRTSPGLESSGWTWSDWDDELWGGTVTVRTERLGRFVFPYPAAGGDVTVDGAPVAASSEGDLLALDLPAGTSVVRASWIRPGPGETFALLGAAGLVAALFGVILAIRPSRAEVLAEAERQEAAARASETAA